MMAIHRADSEEYSKDKFYQQVNFPLKAIKTLDRQNRSHGRLGFWISAQLIARREEIICSCGTSHFYLDWKMFFVN